MPHYEYLYNALYIKVLKCYQKNTLTPNSFLPLEFVAVHYGIASQFWYGVYLGVMCIKLPYSVKKADVMLGTAPIILINILCYYNQHHCVYLLQRQIPQTSEGNLCQQR